MLDLSLGYMFVSIAAIFALGLVPILSSRIYPTSPSLQRRLIAPLLFVLLAGSCFAGLGFQALVLTVIAGLSCIALKRWQDRNRNHAI
ncbi:hypothetical protein IAD21_01713 [Abditibacteriota bacterium]|nr:hypothetical protein IAD21_01713 [Abditibacteriota bacterium]